MWQFFIVLHLALGNLWTGHAQPENHAVGSGFLPLISTIKNSATPNMKLKMNLSNAFVSNGKPIPKDARTMLSPTIIKPISEGIMEGIESYSAPIIHPGRINVSKRSVEVEGPDLDSTEGLSSSEELSVKVKACRTIVAGTVCMDDPADYPSEVARKLAKNEQFKSLYSSYFSSVSQLDSSSNKAANATADDGDGTGLPGHAMCLVQAGFKTFRPQKLMDRNGEWKFIMQQESDNVIQLIPAEACLDTGGPCYSKIVDQLSVGYKCRCIQKYSNQKLVYITKNNTHAVEQFLVPNCCSSSYYSIYD